MTGVSARRPRPARRPPAAGRRPRAGAGCRDPRRRPRAQPVAVGAPRCGRLGARPARRPRGAVAAPPGLSACAWFGRALIRSRHALAYVLNNWRRHHEDHAGLGAGRRPLVDRYSSGVAFGGWAERDGVPFAWPTGFEPLPIAAPTTWLLQQGWRRGGAGRFRQHAAGRHAQRRAARLPSRVTHRHAAGGSRP